MFSLYQKIVLLGGTILTALAVWILSVNSTTQATINTSEDFAATQLNFNTTKELQNYFHSQGYTWPIENGQNIPQITLQSLPDDLVNIQDADLRKSLFIQIMLPIIYAEQRHIRTVRNTIEEKLNRTGNNATRHEWFNKLLQEYNVFDKDFNAQRKNLLSRVDELPTTLILAQAAIESGWGTSRFAREGNSLFGEWTFRKGGGLIPENRQTGKSHQVKAFDSLSASVRSYMKNINRNRAYKELREYRKNMRQNGSTLDAFKLAEGLHRYSQKGEAYVRSLHNVMNSAEFKLIATLESS